MLWEEFRMHLQTCVCLISCCLGANWDDAGTSWEIAMKDVLLYLCLPHLAGSEGVLITAAIGTKM